jgi:mannose-6-phosphate isomerase
MFVGITNTPRDYAWGSLSAIAALFDRAPSGSPEAELWLGTHLGSPARVIEPSRVGGATTLADITTLPFLLKVLAAASPLSLQAHPTIPQAIDGFARENALGIPVDAPDRNYRDELHKPELIYALSDPFVALCGFAEVAVVRGRIDALLAARPDDAPLADWLDRLGGDDDIRSTFEWLISRGEGVDTLLRSVIEAARGVHGRSFSLVGTLADAYPGDPGIAISVMLNLVALKPGEVIYLPAGNIHAYVEGLGIELMAASDNVLRGGLTPKHVDVPELLSVLDFAPVAVPWLRGVPEGGATAFRPPVDDFALFVIETDAEVDLDGPAIALCTSGSFSLEGAGGGVGGNAGGLVATGDSVFISADERRVSVRGAGTLFIATTGAPVAG